MVHNAIGTARMAKVLLVQQTQVSQAIVEVVDTLNTVATNILGIVQRGVGGRLFHNFADLLDPDTRRRIFRGTRRNSGKRKRRHRENRHYQVFSHLFHSVNL